MAKIILARMDEQRRECLMIATIYARNTSLRQTGVTRRGGLNHESRTVRSLFVSTKRKAPSPTNSKLRDAGQREGWTITARYADRAISGTTQSVLTINGLLVDAKAKHFDVLLVDDFSRLSRDSVETE